MSRFTQWFDRISMLLSMSIIAFFIWDFGFEHVHGVLYSYQWVYFLYLFIVAPISFYGDRDKWKNFHWGYFKTFSFVIHFISFLTLIYTAYDLIFRGITLWHHHALGSFSLAWILFFAGLISIQHSFYLEKIKIHPNLLFTSSFTLIILIGSLLLMLPNATEEGIDFIDAAFTATSAVCVTGLTVMNTSADFSDLGQWIILFLIQIGGIGIMTYTGLVAYILRGGSSISNQVILKEMVNARVIGGVMDVIRKILFITLITEIIGACFLYYFMPEASGYRTIPYAVFHAVSAFCNAGFSTVYDGMADPQLAQATGVLAIIMILIILGGLGFNIVFDVYDAGINRLRRIYLQVIQNDQLPPLRRRVHIHTRITLITTGSLLLFGTVMYYILERNNILVGMQESHRWIQALFMSVTSRTAGFNTFNLTSLSLASIMVTLLLMYIGASPNSTGGGIKTTVFAIGVLNIVSLTRGKKNIEIESRVVGDSSIRKAFAIIGLSILAIGIFIFLLSITDRQFTLNQLAFEVFSAFGTVGLSLDVTPHLTTAGKVIIILAMFTGRVGLFSLMLGLIPKASHMRYQLPSEELVVY
ncbi:MAG: hypothetical protein KDC57_15180 [Saprospiraceae bacterium]|nr:hypothetical protein [Saprospiraceae bacterium]